MTELFKFNGLAAPLVPTVILPTTALIPLSTLRLLPGPVVCTETSPALLEMESTGPEKRVVTIPTVNEPALTKLKPLAPLPASVPTRLAWLSVTLPASAMAARRST